jgi:hypothetical protein
MEIKQGQMELEGSSRKRKSADCKTLQKIVIE